MFLPFKNLVMSSHNSDDTSCRMPNPHSEPEYTDPFADPVPAIAITDISLGDAVNEQYVFCFLAFCQSIVQ